MASCVECLHYNVCYKKPIRNVDTELVMIGDCSDYKPTSDVEIVKHGKWLPQIVVGVKAWDCSECKTLGSPHWKRCPICEAKMDGGKEE